MGFGGISIWQLVIVLGIIILLFGTKKLRNLGGDVGSAVKGFTKAMNDDSKDEEDKSDKALDKKEDAQFKEPESSAAKSEHKSDGR